jgi:hypothetical protein
VRCRLRRWWLASAGVQWRGVECRIGWGSGCLLCLADLLCIRCYRTHRQHRHGARTGVLVRPRRTRAIGASANRCVPGQTRNPPPERCASDRIELVCGWGSSPVCSSTLQRSLNGGAWTTVTLTTPTAGSASDTAPAALDSLVYRIQVTGCDGLVSGWVQGPV